MLIHQLTEVAPAGALVAAVAWGTISYVFTGPELATRISDTHYIEACETRLAETIGASFDQQIAATGNPSAVERESAMAAPMMNQMYNQFGDQMAFLDMLSGGVVQQLQATSQNAARQAREAREQAAEAIRAQRERAVASAPDQCSCQVAAALNETRNDWAIFAGTLGVITQDGVTTFPSLMRAHTNTCAERMMQ